MNPNGLPSSKRWRDEKAPTKGISVDQDTSSLLQRPGVSSPRLSAPPGNYPGPASRLDFFQNPVVTTQWDANPIGLNEQACSLPHYDTYRVADVSTIDSYARPHALPPAQPFAGRSNPALALRPDLFAGARDPFATPPSTSDVFGRRTSKIHSGLTPLQQVATNHTSYVSQHHLQTASGFAPSSQQPFAPTFVGQPALLQRPNQVHTSNSPWSLSAGLVNWPGPRAQSSSNVLHVPQSPSVPLQPQQNLHDPVQLSTPDAQFTPSYPLKGTSPSLQAGGNGLYSSPVHTAGEVSQALGLYDGSNDPKPSGGVKSSTTQSKQSKARKKKRKQPTAEGSTKTRWDDRYPGIMPSDLELLHLRGFFAGDWPTITREELLEQIHARTRARGSSEEMLLNTLLAKEKTVVRRWIGLKTFNQTREANGEEPVGTLSKQQQTESCKMGQEVLDKWRKDIKGKKRQDQWTTPGSLGMPTVEELANYEASWPPDLRTEESSSSDSLAPQSPSRTWSPLSLEIVSSPSLPLSTPSARGRERRRSIPGFSRGLSKSSSSTRQGLLQQSPASRLRRRARPRSTAVMGSSSLTMSPCAQTGAALPGDGAGLADYFQAGDWMEPNHARESQISDDAFQLGLAHGRSDRSTTGNDHYPVIDPILLHTGLDVPARSFHAVSDHSILNSTPSRLITQAIFDSSEMHPEPSTQLVPETPQENAATPDTEDLFSTYLNVDMWS